MNRIEDRKNTRYTKTSNEMKNAKESEYGERANSLERKKDFLARWIATHPKEVPPADDAVTFESLSKLSNSNLEALCIAYVEQFVERLYSESTKKFKERDEYSTESSRESMSEDEDEDVEDDDDDANIRLKLNTGGKDVNILDEVEVLS